MIIKRERMQVIISFFACVMLLLAFINILFNHEQIEAQAATVGWVQESNGKWRYYHANGSYTISDWEKINEKWYHFDSQGYMQTGWIYVNSKWYYLKSSGAMKTGWLHLNNKWYYLKSSGAAAISEWEKINDEWYYFGSDRVMYVGSCNVAGVPSLFGANGNLISQNLPVTAEAQSNESSCWAACAVMVGRYRTNSTRTQSMVINRYPFAITANEVDSLNYTVKAVKYVSINTKNAFSQSPLYSYAQVQSQIRDIARELANSLRNLQKLH